MAALLTLPFETVYTYETNNKSKFKSYGHIMYFKLKWNDIYKQFDVIDCHCKQMTENKIKPLQPDLTASITKYFMFNLTKIF